MTRCKIYATSEIKALWQAVDTGSEKTLVKQLRFVPKSALGASLLDGKLTILYAILFRIGLQNDEDFPFRIITHLLNAGAPLAPTSDLQYDATDDFWTSLVARLHEMYSSSWLVTDRFVHSLCAYTGSSPRCTNDARLLLVLRLIRKRDGAGPLTETAHWGCEGTETSAVGALCHVDYWLTRRPLAVADRLVALSNSAHFLVTAGGPDPRTFEDVRWLGFPTTDPSLVDVLDTMCKWMPARVIGTSSTGTRVHYLGWCRAWDEDIKVEDWHRRTAKFASRWTECIKSEYNVDLLGGTTLYRRVQATRNAQAIAILDSALRLLDSHKRSVQVHLGQVVHSRLSSLVLLYAF